MDGGGDPGGAGVGVAAELVVTRTGDADPDALAQEGPRRGELAGPAGAEEVLRLDGAGEPADQRGRALAPVSYTHLTLPTILLV